MAIPDKTQFTLKVERHQEAQERTAASKNNSAFILLIVGVGVSAFLYMFPALVALVPVIGWAGYVIARLGPADWAPWVVLATISLVHLMAGAAAIWGIAKFISAAKTPVRSITCPMCSASADTFITVRRTICPGCTRLLILGDATPPDLRLLACGYCGLESIVAADVGTFRCSNCAVPRTGNDTLKFRETDPCPRCASPVPKQAIFCKSCGELLRDDLYTVGSFREGYDIDWLAGMDTAGLRRFASAVSRSIATRAQERDQIKYLAPLFTDLEMVIVCLEHVCNAERPPSSSASLLADLDHLYGRVLARVLELIEAEPARKYEKGELKSLNLLAYRAARRKLEERFAALIPAPSRWANSLVDIADTATGKQQIKSWTALRNEVGRLQQFSREPV